VNIPLQEARKIRGETEGSLSRDGVSLVDLEEKNKNLGEGKMSELVLIG